MKWLAGLSGLGTAFIGLLKSREDRKATQKVVEGKLSKAKLDGEKEVTLRDREIEVIHKTNEKTTWKDEYALIVTTFPTMVMLPLAAFVSVLMGHDQLLLATQSALDILKETGIPIDYLAGAAIATSLGIRLTK